MPRLFVASGIFHPEPGGPATYLKSILPALAETGWQTRVLTYGADQDLDYPYPVQRIARSAYPLRRARYGFAAARHSSWADLIYAHTIDLPLWGRRGKPRVIKIVGDQAWERCVRRRWIPPDMTIDEFQTFAGDTRVRWQKRSRSQQVQAMDTVIVPSEYLRRMVSGWDVDPGKIHVIYNALPQPQRPKKSRASIRAELGWEDRPTLLTVARLQPWKGIDHLLNAVVTMPDLRLIVVGDGPDRGRLERLAEPLADRVTFTGRLSQEEVFRFMVAADAYALYSGYEGMAHTLLESLQLGTPVLASDVGGNAELVRHEVNGLLVPHVDIEALRRGIREMLDRRAEFAANSQAGMEIFRFDLMVRQTDQLLRSLLP